MEKLQQGALVPNLSPMKSSLELAVNVTFNLQAVEVERERDNSTSNEELENDSIPKDSDSSILESQNDDSSQCSVSSGRRSELLPILQSPLDDVELVPEGEWGWAICAAAFVVQFVVLGIHNSFGILFTFLLDEFQNSKAATAWVGSASVGIMYLFGPVATGLSERIGCKTVAFIGGVLCVLGMLLTSFVTDLQKIYITYSLLWGIGSSFCYFPTLTLPGEYFCRRLSLVNGIVTAGSGIGTLTFGPLLQYLLKNYGLSSTLRILSGVMSVLLVASLIYKRFRSPLEQLYDIRRRPGPLLDLTVWTNKAFIVYTVAVSLFMLGYFIPYVHMVSHVVGLGVSASDGALLIGYMSISSTISRLLFGRFSDHPRVNRLYMTQFAVVGFGITTTLCPIARSYQSFVVVVVMLGLFDGMYVVLIAVVITDIVGVHKLNQALGNLYGVISVAITVGAPLAGLIYDALLSYNTAFYISGATTTLASILMFLIPWLMPNTHGGRFNRDSTASRIDSLLTSIRSNSANPSASGNREVEVSDSAGEEGAISPPLFTEVSLDTSKNTTFNSSMSHRGSVTKSLSSRQLCSRSGSPIGSTGGRESLDLNCFPSTRNPPTMQLFTSKLLKNLQPGCKSPEDSRVVRETRV